MGILPTLVLAALAVALAYAFPRYPDQRRNTRRLFQPSGTALSFVARGALLATCAYWLGWLAVPGALPAWARGTWAARVAGVSFFLAAFASGGTARRERAEDPERPARPRRRRGGTDRGAVT